jgi:hypothetical protein
MRMKSVCDEWKTNPKMTDDEYYKKMWAAEDEQRKVEQHVIENIPVEVHIGTDVTSFKKTEGTKTEGISKP